MSKDRSTIVKFFQQHRVEVSYLQFKRKNKVMLAHVFSRSLKAIISKDNKYVFSRRSNVEK